MAPVVMVPACSDAYIAKAYIVTAYIVTAATFFFWGDGALGGSFRVNREEPGETNGIKVVREGYQGAWQEGARSAAAYQEEGSPESVQGSHRG